MFKTTIPKCLAFKDTLFATVWMTTKEHFDWKHSALVSRVANFWQPKRVQIKVKKGVIFAQREHKKKICMRTAAKSYVSPLRYKRVHFKWKMCKLVTLFLELTTLLTKLPTTDIQSERKLTPKKSFTLPLPLLGNKECIWHKSVQVGNRACEDLQERKRSSPKQLAWNLSALYTQQIVVIHFIVDNQLTFRQTIPWRANWIQIELFLCGPNIYFISYDRKRWEWWSEIYMMFGFWEIWLDRPP